MAPAAPAFDRRATMGLPPEEPDAATLRKELAYATKDMARMLADGTDLVDEARAKIQSPHAAGAIESVERDAYGERIARIAAAFDALHGLESAQDLDAAKNAAKQAVLLALEPMDDNRTVWEQLLANAVGPAAARESLQTAQLLIRRMAIDEARAHFAPEQRAHGRIRRFIINIVERGSRGAPDRLSEAVRGIGQEDALKAYELLNCERAYCEAQILYKLCPDLPDAPEKNDGAAATAEYEARLREIRPQVLATRRRMSKIVPNAQQGIDIWKNVAMTDRGSFILDKDSRIAPADPDGKDGAGLTEVIRFIRRRITPPPEDHAA